MATNSMYHDTPSLPDDVVSWLKKFDQCEESNQYSDLYGGGLSSDQAMAAQQHERDVYDMIKLAAKRVVAEIGSDVYVIRPKQPRTHSINGYSIKPDFLVVIKGKGTKCIVVDAKNHQAYIPPKEWRKTNYDMGEVKV